MEGESYMSKEEVKETPRSASSQIFALRERDHVRKSGTTV